MKLISLQKSKITPEELAIIQKMECLHFMNITEYDRPDELESGEIGAIAVRLFL